MRHAVAGPEPAARVEVEEPLRSRRPLLQLGGERREHLQPGRRELAAESELDRGAGHARREERLGLVGGKPGQPRPVPAREPVAAGRAAQRLERDARLGERGDVAVDGANRDLEPVGELPGGELRAGLEQKQHRDEPVPHVSR